MMKDMHMKVNAKNVEMFIICICIYVWPRHNYCKLLQSTYKYAILHPICGLHLYFLSKYKVIILKTQFILLIPFKQSSSPEEII
jgi:hypothetical protein